MRQKSIPVCRFPSVKWRLFLINILATCAHWNDKIIINYSLLHFQGFLLHRGPSAIQDGECIGALELYREMKLFLVPWVKNDLSKFFLSCIWLTTRTPLVRTSFSNFNRSLTNWTSNLSRTAQPQATCLSMNVLSPTTVAMVRNNSSGGNR